MIREILNEKKEDKKKEDNFKTHPMYDPTTGKKIIAKKHKDHVDLAKKGYTHVDPKVLTRVLKDEGGAAGLEPFIKATKADAKQIKLTLKNMPKVGQHSDGDYILADDEEVKIVKEIKKAIIKEIADILGEKKNVKNARNARRPALNRVKNRR